MIVNQYFENKLNSNIFYTKNKYFEQNKLLQNILINDLIYAKYNIYLNDTCISIVKTFKLLYTKI